MSVALRAVAALLLALVMLPCHADGNPFKPDAHESAFGIYGDAMQYLLPLGAAGVTLARHDSEGFRQVAGGCALTIGSAHLFKALLNNTALGRRPDGGTHSFPSGHTAAAMCGAMGLQSRYGNSMGLPAVALATTVGFSRIAEQRHHVRDVAASTLLAWVGSQAAGHGNEAVSVAVPAAAMAVMAGYGQWGPVTRKPFALGDDDNGSQGGADMGLTLQPDARGRAVPTLRFAVVW